MRLLQYAPPQDKAGELRPGYLRELYQCLTEIGDILKASAFVAIDALWQAKGDLAVGTGDETADRLAVGANNTVLTADSAQALGVKWAALPAGTITVRKGAGADVGPRPRISFIEGANTTLTVADDAGNNEVDVTIAGTTPLTTKGDLLTNTGAADARQAAGANNTLLVADNAQANGIKWQALESVPHGERVRVVSPASGQRALASSATWAFGAGFDTTNVYWTGSISGQVVVIVPLDLLVGDRIKLVKMYGRTFAAADVWSLKVFKKPMTSGAATQLGATKTSVFGGAAADDTLTSDALTETVAAATQYYAVWTGGGSDVGVRLYGLELTYDRP